MKNLKARVALSSNRTVIFDWVERDGMCLSEIIVFPNPKVADEVVKRINRPSDDKLKSELDGLKQKIKSLLLKIDEE